MTATKNYILDELIAEKKMRRMALEIIENNAEETELILAGIRESGSVIAKILQRFIAEYSTIKTQLIAIGLDKKHPVDVQLSQTPVLDDKVIIVIDDVANSGKTMLYALKPFLAYHPKKIQTAILVGRSHNSFPIQTDYVGLSVATTLQEHIFVEVSGDKVTGAYLR